MKNQVQIPDTLLPICAACKRIRDTSGVWHSIEENIRASLEINFTHTICPDCASQLYPTIVEHLFAEAQPVVRERAYGQHQ